MKIFYSLIIVLCEIVLLARCLEGENIGVVREVWNNVKGGSLQNLLADVRFPHKPSKVYFLKDFDAPENDGKEYAQRIKGYFTAPEDGKYKFYSSCDDSCEIFLGVDGKEGENNRIISQTSPSKHNEFNRFQEQSSNPISLEKGKRYYLEAISNQREGDENLSVGVELPNGSKFFPIPSSFLHTGKDDLGTSIDKKYRPGDETKSERKDKTNVLVPQHDIFAKNTNDRSESISNSKTLITSFMKKTKDKAVTGHGRGLEDNTSIDADGKTYSDTDSVEPGINIFPGKKEAPDDAKISKEKDELDEETDKDGGNVLFDNSDSSVTSETHKPSFTVPVSFDDSKENESKDPDSTGDDKDVTEKNEKSESTSRNIEANFDGDDENKSENIAKALNNALRNTSATGKLKMWMPGGKVKIIGSDQNRPKFEMTPKQRDESPTPDAVENKVQSETDSEKQEKSPEPDESEEKEPPSKSMISNNHDSPDGNHKESETSKKFLNVGGFGGISGGFGGNEIASGTSVNGIGHPSMPEGHGVYAPEIHTTHHSNAVAMVPAVIHHDHHDHHVEPLAPVSNMPAGSIMPGHLGGGQEVMHEMGGSYDLHGPCHHPCHDHHHVEVMPVMEPPVVAPAPPVHHKPDIIKVEFVPEEAKITIGNKSNIVNPTDKKAGTVRVQFIPGEVITDTPKYDTAAVTRQKSKSDSDFELTKGSPKTVRPVSRHTHNIHHKESTATAHSRYHEHDRDKDQSFSKHHEEVEDELSDSKVAEQVESKLTHDADEMQQNFEGQIRSKSTAINPAIGTTLNVQTSQGRAQVTVEDLKPTANGGQQETVSGKVMADDGKVMPFHVTVVTDKDGGIGKTVQAADPLHQNSKVYQAHPSTPNAPGYIDAMEKGSKQGKTPPVELPLPAPKYGNQMIGQKTMETVDNRQFNQSPLSSGNSNSASSGGGPPGPTSMVSGNTQESVEPEVPPGMESQFPELAKAQQNAQPTVGGASSNSPPPGAVFFSGGVGVPGATGSDKPGTDRVFFGGGSTSPAGDKPGEEMYNGAFSRSDRNTASGGQPGLPSPMNQLRDPQNGPQIALPAAPVNTSPDSPKGPIVNPVANKLQDALNNQQLSTEEALQMMNDFVSGNQDMSKSINNINGMLDQVAQSRHKTENPTREPVQNEPSSTLPQGNPKVDENRHFYPSDSEYQNSQNEPFHSPPTGPYQNQYSQLQPVQHEYQHGDYNFPPEGGDSMAFQASQRNEQQLPPGLPSMSDNDISRSSEMSPNGPPPPVHVYDRNDNMNHEIHGPMSPSPIDTQERGMYHPVQQMPPENIGNLIFPQIHSQESTSRDTANSMPNGNMLVDPVSSTPFMSDGYSNPSFRKHVPTIQNVPQGNILDRIDPHEMMPNGGISRDTDGIFRAGSSQSFPGQVHHNAGLSPNMPVVENLVGSATITHENEHVTYNNMYSDGGQNYNDYGIPDSKYSSTYETEAQEPVGHLGPVTQDSGSDQYASRKFRIQSRQKTIPNIINHKIELAPKGASKSEQATKKHKSLSAMYTDSIFPEDFADIESLKGSLQGKTLTNFDSRDGITLKSHTVTGSRKSIVQDLDVKASFPVEANANDEGGRDTGHQRSHIMSSKWGRNAPKTRSLAKMVRSKRTKDLRPKILRTRPRHVRSIDILPNVIQTDTATVRSVPEQSTVKDIMASKSAPGYIRNSARVSNFQAAQRTSLAKNRPSEHLLHSNFRDNADEPVQTHRMMLLGIRHNKLADETTTPGERLADSSMEFINNEKTDSNINSQENGIKGRVLKQVAMPIDVKVSSDKQELSPVLTDHVSKFNQENGKEVPQNELKASNSSPLESQNSAHQLENANPSDNSDEKNIKAATTLHVQEGKNDQASLRALVTELKDVLHKLRDERHRIQLTNMQTLGQTYNSAINTESIPSNYQLSFSKYPYSDSSHYPEPSTVIGMEREQIARSFMQSQQTKLDGENTMDIERFSQDVWEPGTRGELDPGANNFVGVTYNRATIPLNRRGSKNLKQHIKKHHKRLKSSRA